MSRNPLDEHYELLSKLYLRLKGYVVTNLIIHSDNQGYEKSELDILAVRMPFHCQDYRDVNVPDYLESSNTRIEILIGDVKNKKKLADIKFNDGLRRDKLSIKQLIDWIGVYKKVDNELIQKFECFLNLHRKKDWKGFAEFNEDFEFASYNFKFTFFCPSLSKWKGDGFKYIDGDEMIAFIWECLNKMKEVVTCSRQYNFDHWKEFRKYVDFFKDENKVSVTKEDFENHFKAIKN